ncbi:hypothetical protein BpHYR1_002579 [Brachionus plicatilis]|uniref:Hermes trasposase DNA-binding domain-containing protein n=1 Tax=Brachionus plicatilis TaxID=10195 RepID=A0A3M7PBY3_BRAPC|nr:hypothetical protein BpHYR1_002579 [Brachionus plicatilis]
MTVSESSSSESLIASESGKDESVCTNSTESYSDTRNTNENSSISNVSPSESQNQTQNSAFVSSNTTSSSTFSSSRRKKRTNVNSETNGKDHIEAIKKFFCIQNDSTICKFEIPQKCFCNQKFSNKTSSSSLKYHLKNCHGLTFDDSKSSSKIFKPNVDEKLIEWIIDDLQPFSVVEGKKFIELVEMLDSSYKIHCLSKIEYSIDDLFEKSLEN